MHPDDDDREFARQLFGREVDTEPEEPATPGLLVPREGNSPTAPPTNDALQTVRELFTS